MTTKDEMISVGDAAAMCGVHHDTFLRWLIKGVIPFIRVGPNRARRVKRADVEGLIEPGS